ncbi:MAG: hypothetical protein KBF88_14820 [Polyangiaceae bacterium]|nr:hypothetical protein [Polyangiaceae bacterium]
MNARLPRLTMTLLFAVSLAFALPKEGDDVGKGTVVDVDGNTFTVESTLGKPLLIVYEDKNSGTQNNALKEELGTFARDPKYKSMVLLAAVADVSSYNFWPARGFVKDAIRKESTKANTPIYCDWTGAFREALGLTRGKSNIVFVDKAGKVRYVAAGSMGEGARKRLLDLIRKEVEG